MLYLELCRVLERLEGTTKRLEKTYFISEFLKKVPAEDLNKIMLFLAGRIFPSWDERKVGFSDSLVLKAINIATGVDLLAVKEKWKETGDLGLTAGNLVGVKKQATLFSEKLTVDKVFLNLRKLSSTEGEGSVDYKVKLVAELLSSASPLEARYVVRTVLDLLRVGIGDGTLRDALVWNLTEVNYNPEEKSIEPADRGEYNQVVETVQEAYDILNDFSELASVLNEKGLEGLSTVKLIPGKPLKVMLGPKEESIADAFERVGRPAALEFKLDGFRMQIHKFDGKIKVFTRRLDEVTKQFPEVVGFMENVSGDSFILDAEAVGFDPKTGKFLPFQKVSQRIKRKYDIHQMAKDFPVELNVFDIVHYNGEDLLKKSFSERRKLLGEIVKEEKNKIILVNQLVTDSDDKAAEFYQESLSLGNEGIMFKKLDGAYRPGARVGMMVKMKPVMETLDLVVVGAEWGEGKRAEWLSSFILACRDENGELFEIGRTGTGFKEKEEEGLSFKEMTERLKPLVVSEKGKLVRVKASIVLEINYEEIQQSPTYGSGFALRFPRVIKVREDRGPEDCSALSQVKELFEQQKSQRDF